MKTPDPFDPFASLQVHKAFLLDDARNNAYRRAISRAATSGNTAVEIGSGTGILSFFAAKAGFRKVTAIERTPLAAVAREVARDNHLDDQVHFIQEDLFAANAVGRHDVLIHEQIGTFVWDEEMIEKVAFARKKFLRPGGQILPCKIDFFVVPISLPARPTQPFFWERPRYGISFRKFRELERSADHPKPGAQNIRLPNKDSYLANPQKIASMDFYKKLSIPQKLSATFAAQKPASILTGFLGFLTVHLDSKTRFSTGPGSGTHWGQIYLPLATSEVVLKQKFHLDLYPRAKPKEWKWEVRV